MEIEHEAGHPWAHPAFEQYYQSRYRVGGGPEFIGWSDGSLRDGWEAPLFEHHEAARVLGAYWRGLGWAYEQDADMFILNAPPGTDEEFITVTGRWIPAPYGRRRAYDVGWGWTWYEADHGG